MVLKKSFSDSFFEFIEKKQRIVLDDNTILCITRYNRRNMIIRKVNVMLLLSICPTIWIFLRPYVSDIYPYYDDEQLYLDLNVDSRSSFL